MSPTLVRCGKSVVNIEHLADAKWEGEKLYLHFHNGAFQSFNGRAAMLIWKAIAACAVDLETGEVAEGT